MNTDTPSRAPGSALPNSRPFQILALDGGGVRGIFTAALLARLEEDTGVPIVDRFDLIVGTSTGGIVALGLGAGLRPVEILDFYVANKDLIFPRRRFTMSFRRLFSSKYDPAPLEAALRRVFGDKFLGESTVPLVIPSYDLGENAPHLFKTPHHERLRRDHRVPMWQVAMATGAAPTFFPAFRLPNDEARLIDGGVWANNPAMVGVTEAVSMFGRSLQDLRVLSIGTTSTKHVRTARLDRGGLIHWARSPNVVDVILNGQSAGAFNEVQHLIGVNAHRLDPAAPDALAKLDACDVGELIAKAAHHSRSFCPTFEREFGSHIPARYIPLYGPKAPGGLVDSHH